MESKTTDPKDVIAGAMTGAYRLGWIHGKAGLDMAETFDRHGRWLYENGRAAAIQSLCDG